MYLNDKENWKKKREREKPRLNVCNRKNNNKERENKQTYFIVVEIICIYVCM